jgi:glucose/arabinose dehydrogenase
VRHRRIAKVQRYSAALMAFVLFVLIRASAPVAALTLERIELPAGFSISLFATGVRNARQLTSGAEGIVYVGTRRAGVVYAVVDEDGDYRADHVYTIADGLYMPSGVAYRDGILYVAEVNRILAFDDVDKNLESPPKPRVVFEQLPRGSYHGWKFIEFGPDGKLYVPVGAPCNVCNVEDPYGTILRVDVDNGSMEIVARGVRNSVGFAWHPLTNELWFTDNGRDMMGDDIPPGELNRVTRSDQHFGFPYIHGGDISDPKFGVNVRLEDYTKPALKLGAHVAPLGPLFYTGKLFPQEYQFDLLIAEHGSWNRSRKSGYRIMRAHFDKHGDISSYEPFATGWLVGEENWGRPVDLEQLPDGSILVSDDDAGVLYRISYGQAAGEMTK